MTCNVHLWMTVRVRVLSNLWVLYLIGVSLDVFLHLWSEPKLDLCRTEFGCIFYFSPICAPKTKKNLKPEKTQKKFEKTRKKSIYKTWCEPDPKPNGFKFGCQISPTGLNSGVKFNPTIFFYRSEFQSNQFEPDPLTSYLQPDLRIRNTAHTYIGWSERRACVLSLPGCLVWRLVDCMIKISARSKLVGWRSWCDLSMTFGVVLVEVPRNLKTCLVLLLWEVRFSEKLLAGEYVVWKIEVFDNLDYFKWILC
jgi:hypothetical protein